MPSDIPLRCACGKIRGTALHASGSTGSRVFCYCDDCQAFARFLGRPDILNEQGGTDIYQMAPARLKITAGMDALRCVRLSDKGLHRWYCGECRTPLGNTRPPIPFLGVVQPFMDHASDGRTREEALGEPLGHIMTEWATGPVPRRPGDVSLLRLIARSLRLVTTWMLTRVSSPSPFFDERGAPRVTPQVLTPEERRALDRH